MSILDGKDTKTHLTSYPLQQFLYKAVPGFLPANIQNRLKALSEASASENTRKKKWERVYVLFLSDTMGRNVSDFEVCSLFPWSFGRRV